jgi:sigma-B regulation protein RsbU (phosphoserine phosphatase)
VLRGSDLVGALLGTLFITLGLAAIVGARLRSETRDRSLIWFGVVTLLYGVRVTVRSDIIQAVVAPGGAARDFIEAWITFIIVVPMVLLATAVFGPGPHGLRRRLFQADLIYALVAIACDVITRRPGAIMFVNPVAVVANVVVLVASLAANANPRTWTRDGWLVAGGLAVFTVTALIETTRGSLFGRWDAEPLAMLIFVVCLGYAAANRVFRNERRLAAVARELDMARRIQQSILPRHAPTVSGLRVASHYEPMSEVAGDLFDFVVTPSGQLGVLVADVSGHGVPAAIIASMVKIALVTQRDRVDDPGTVLTEINRALYGQFELAYVTATFLLIDPRAGRLTYSSAGHPPPLLARRSGSLERLDQGGIVLGFLPETRYETAVAGRLEQGDRLVLYTDGLTEATRDGGEFFGDRQFQDHLTRHRALPIGQFTSQLVDAARGWAGVATGALSDDVTVVVIECT